MTGVPPSGSGSRASHEAAKASSPEASIPNAAFTPGPWSIVEGDSVVRVVADGGSVVATDTKPYYEPFDATDLANARLIASAPKLYAMLADVAYHYRMLARFAEAGRVYEIEKHTGKKIRRSLRDAIGSECEAGFVKVESLLALARGEAL